MKISKNGYDFIVSMEGKRNKSYQDSIGKWTCGIGFIQVDGHPVTANFSMTDAQIEKEFYKQISLYEDCINNNVKVTLTQNKFDALVSFTFNLGCAAFKSSTLLKKINISAPIEEIGIEFNKWCKAGGKVIDGLAKRRAAEYKLYCS